MIFDASWIAQFSISEVLDFLAFIPTPYGGDFDDPCGPWALYGSAFNAVTAAFATLGYMAQSDLLAYMGGGFNKFAALIYTIGGIGGILMMAMGQPPKNYLWFFIGPGLFHFLVATPQLVHGVAWMIGPYKQSQKEVWKLAEAGMVNTRRATKDPNFKFDIRKGPSKPFEVAMPFVIFDMFVSETVRNLSTWAGVGSQVAAKSGVEAKDTNVDLQYPNTPYSDLRFGASAEDSEQCESQAGGRHYAAVTDMKWQLLNSVVSAELSNTEARDAFARFMSNECGEKLSASINFGRMAGAVHQTGALLPTTVMKLPGDKVVPGSEDVDIVDYGVLKSNLAQQYIPMPQSVVNLLAQDPTRTSFVNSLAQNFPEKALELISSDRIRCDTLAFVLILYFRYEAGQIYVNAFQNAAPTGWQAQDAAYSMLYGWDIPYTSGEGDYCRKDGGMGSFQQEQFVYNMILAHLFRNEMRKLPELVSVSTDGSSQVIADAELFNATAGSTSKYAEVYTWSLMIPYIQGVALYVLTMSYPLVCMLMLVPQWNKMLFTWATFFIWIKLWDLGFAIVTTIERSLWAMMANDNTSVPVNEKLLEMARFGGFDWYDCGKWEINEFSLGSDGNLVRQSYGSCIDPYLTVTNGISEKCDFATASNLAVDVMKNDNIVSSGVGPTDVPEGVLDASLRIFDISLILSGAMDFDIANGYYVYLMSALYFAVPAITGQMVLGAKAQAASFVDKMASDPAGKAASGAQSGYQSNIMARGKQNAASMSQESHAMGHRQSGLMHQALSQQNQAGHYERLGAKAQAAEQGWGRFSNANTLNYSTAERKLSAVKESAKHTAAAANNDPPILGGSNNQVTGGTNAPRPNKHGDAATGSSATGASVTGDGGLTASNTIDSGSSGMSYDKGGVPQSNSERGYHGGMNSALGRKYGDLNAKRIQGHGGAFLTGLQDQSKREFDNVGAMLEVGSGYALAEMNANKDAMNNEFTARGGHEGLQGYKHNQMSKGYRSAGERTMAAANFAAASQNYQTMNKFAQGRSRFFSVVGGAPGGMFAPDKRPEDAMGMSMSGMVDTYGATGLSRNKTKKESSFFNPRSGQFGRDVQSSYGELSSAFGYHPVSNAYKNIGYGEVVSSAVDHAGTAFASAKMAPGPDSSSSRQSQQPAAGPASANPMTGQRGGSNKNNKPWKP